MNMYFQIANFEIPISDYGSRATYAVLSDIKISEIYRCPKKTIMSNLQNVNLSRKRGLFSALSLCFFRLSN